MPEGKIPAFRPSKKKRPETELSKIAFAVQFADSLCSYPDFFPTLNLREFLCKRSDSKGDLLTRDLHVPCFSSHIFRDILEDPQLVIICHFPSHLSF